MELVRDAGADEIVCHQDYGLGLLAQSALEAKIVEVYHDLLRYSADTCEIYVLRSPTPEGSEREEDGSIPKKMWDRLFANKTFPEATDVFNRTRDRENPAILIGIRRGDRVYINPRDPLRMQVGDDLVLIAWNRPRLDNIDLLLRSAAAQTA
jgi:hypothetical protein